MARLATHTGNSITPVPLPHAARHVLIVGGSFDPPHRWHTRIASAARRSAFGNAGWIIFVPSARSPLKVRGPFVSDRHRLAMLRIAISGLHRAAIWTDELDRAAASPNQPSFTIDTVRRLRSEIGTRPHLRLLIGADQAAQFHKWRCHEELIRLAEPLVALRRPISTPSALRQALTATRSYSSDQVDAWMDRIVPCTISQVSSSSIRLMLSQGLQPPPRSLHAAVRRYIRSRRLYLNE